MTKNKPKYYVVWIGVEPGIYTSWEDCQLQIKGYAGAKFKSFDSLKEAENAFEKGFSDQNTQYKKNKKAINPTAKEIIQNSICVDAACSGNPGIMEYRGVYTASNTEIFRQGPYKQGTNNIGEFLAIVHALALNAQWIMKKQADQYFIIYSDSATAISWIKKKKCGTKLEKVKDNEAIFDLIERAEKWLSLNKYPNKIIKWNTKEWGEIPADFGRK